MIRGDFVTIALSGDLGKPRPALVIQADHFNTLASITVLPITSLLLDAPLLRIDVPANERSGLQKPSQIMIDKAMTIKRDKVGPSFGRITSEALVQVERSLAVFLGIIK